MPTIKRQGGFEVIINTRDEHLPPHVHVIKAEGVVVINLGNARTPPYLDDEEDGAIEMSKKDVRKALEIVTEHQRDFLNRWWEIWRQIHG
jgi:hypothetical protein